MEQKVCANLECGHDRCPVKCEFFSFFLFLCLLLAGQTDRLGCLCMLCTWFVLLTFFSFGRPSSSSASGSWDFQMNEMNEDEDGDGQEVRKLVGFDDSMIR